MVQKIVIPAQQQAKKSRDPWWDEFIRSVGQIGQLIMLLSGRQEGERGEGGGGVSKDMRGEWCSQKIKDPKIRREKR